MLESIILKLDKLFKLVKLDNGLKLEKNSVNIKYSNFSKVLIA